MSNFFKSKRHPLLLEIPMAFCTKRRFEQTAAAQLRSARASTKRKSTAGRRARSGERRGGWLVTLAFLLKPRFLSLPLFLYARTQCTPLGRAAIGC